MLVRGAGGEHGQGARTGGAGKGRWQGAWAAWAGRAGGGAGGAGRERGQGVLVGALAEASAPAHSRSLA